MFLSTGEEGDMYSAGSLRKSQPQLLGNPMSVQLQLLYKYLRPGFVEGK
jgi:hypothetical protein